MTKINPYHIVKQASLFNEDGYLNTGGLASMHYTDTVAPLVGMLLGGGIGAYRGTSAGDKILKGLTGAGVGGLVGMGVNHVLDRTYNSRLMKDLNNVYHNLSDENSRLSRLTQELLSNWSRGDSPREADKYYKEVYPE